MSAEVPIGEARINSFPIYMYAIIFVAFVIYFLIDLG